MWKYTPALVVFAGFVALSIGMAAYVTEPIQQVEQPAVVERSPSPCEEGRDIEPGCERLMELLARACSGQENVCLRIAGDLPARSRRALKRELATADAAEQVEGGGGPKPDEDRPPPTGPSDEGGPDPPTPTEPTPSGPGLPDLPKPELPDVPVPELPGRPEVPLPEGFPELPNVPCVPPLCEVFDDGGVGGRTPESVGGVPGGEDP